MKVTVVGDTRWAHSAEADWLDGFRSEGWDVAGVHEVKASRSQIVGAARASDLLVWVGANRTHDRRVMLDAGEHCRTVGYHADLMWGLAGRGPDWLQAPSFAAQTVFTADGGNADRWVDVGVEHRWLLPGVRERWLRTPGAARSGMVCDLAFVGSDGSRYHREWPYRGELVSRLQAMCERNGWSFRNPGGLHRKVERSGRMNDFYRSARVTVGDSLCLDRENARYWSDRVYEATGRGGLVIMPHIDVLSAQAGSALPTYPWEGWDALEAQIGAYLADPVENTAQRQRSRAWAADHTYRQRVRQLVAEVGL